MKVVLSLFFPILTYISEKNVFSNKKKKIRAGLDFGNWELIGWLWSHASSFSHPCADQHDQRRVIL